MSFPRSPAAAYTSPTLRRLGGDPYPKAWVALFAHAGGGASSLADLAANLPPWIGSVGIEYAGRGRRISEPVAVDLPTMARDVVDACGAFGDLPLVLFGHSMGGLVAYEVSRELARGGRPAALTIISATRAPHVPARPILGATATTTEVVDRLRRLNGMDFELLENEEFLAFALVAYRADALACEAYQTPQAEEIGSPARIYGGLSDPFVERRDLEDWRDVAGPATPVRMFPGDHFYLRSDPATVAEVIARDVVAAALG